MGANSSARACGVRDVPHSNGPAYQIKIEIKALTYDSQRAQKIKRNQESGREDDCESRGRDNLEAKPYY